MDNNSNLVGTVGEALEAPNFGEMMNMPNIQQPQMQQMNQEQVQQPQMNPVEQPQMQQMQMNPVEQPQMQQMQMNPVEQPQMQQMQMNQEQVQQPQMQQMQMNPVEQPQMQQMNQEQVQQVQPQMSPVQQPQTQQVEQPQMQQEQVQPQMQQEQVQPQTQQMNQPQEVQQVQQQEQIQVEQTTPDVVKDAPITNFEIAEDSEDFSQISSPQVDSKPKEIKPIEYKGLKCLITLAAGEWSIFYNLLTFISSQLKKSDVINIENGKIVTIQSSTLIECNLTRIVGNELDLKISSPEIFIKKCKTIIGGDQIQIFADYDEKQYYFCKVIDGKITTRVPISFVAEHVDTEGSMIPQGLQPVSLKQINADEMVIIKTMLGIKNTLGYESFYFCFNESKELSSISLNSSENGEIKEIFKDAKNEKEFAVSFPFTPKTTECSISFYEDPENPEQGYIQCINNIGGSSGSITLTEKVRVKTDLDAFDFNGQ